MAYTLKSPQRKEFFRVWDARPQGQSMREFCAIHKEEQWCPSHSHGYRWLKERDKIIKEGLGSPTRRLPPQKPQGRPKKDTSHTLKAMTERPRSQTVKQHVAQSGVSAATLYRHLKAQRQTQGDLGTQSPRDSPSRPGYRRRRMDLREGRRRRLPDYDDYIISRNRMLDERK